MHIYQLLPYVLSTSFSTHPKRQTWDKKRPPFYIFESFCCFFLKGSPIHQYFDILKSFYYFWALDMAPTWAVPGLFIFRHTNLIVHGGG